MDAFYSTMIQVIMVLWLVIAIQTPWASRAFVTFVAMTHRAGGEEESTREWGQLVLDLTFGGLAFLVVVLFPTVLALAGSAVCIDHLTQGAARGWVSFWHQAGVNLASGPPPSRPTYAEVVGGTSPFDLMIVNDAVLILFVEAAIFSLFRFFVAPFDRGLYQLGAQKGKAPSRQPDPDE